jgi:hypothetical protein
MYDIFFLICFNIMVFVYVRHAVTAVEAKLHLHKIWLDNLMHLHVILHMYTYVICISCVCARARARVYMCDMYIMCVCACARVCWLYASKFSKFSHQCIYPVSMSQNVITYI